MIGFKRTEWFVDADAQLGQVESPKDLHELRDEMQMLLAQGHRGFKCKYGGLPLKEDLACLRSCAT